MSDAAFARVLIEKKLATRAGIARAKSLQAELAGAGLALGLDEVFVHSGKLADDARRTARRAIGESVPAPPALERAEDEERLERAVRVNGLVSPEDLDAIREFQAWAHDRGICLDLALLLEKRGHLEGAAIRDLLRARSSDRPTRGTARASRGGTRTRSARAGSRASRQSRSLERPARSRGLVIGLAAGTAFLILVVAILVALSAGGGDGGTSDSTRQASKPGGQPGASPSSTASESDSDRSARDARLESEKPRDSVSSARGPDEERSEDPPRADPTPDAPDSIPASETPIRTTLSIEELRRRGDQAHKEGRPREAIEYYSQVLDLAPGSHDVLTARARSYRKTDRYLHALADLDRAEAVFPPDKRNTPEFGQVLADRSQTYTQLLEFESARRDARRFMELHPATASYGHLLTGAAHRMEGRLDEAFRDLGESIRLDPTTSVSAALFLGLVHLEKGKRDDALEIFEKAEQDFASRPGDARSAIACQAWAWADPASGQAPDLSRARSILDQKLPARGAITPMQVYASASIAALEGDYRNAYRLFQMEFYGWEVLPPSGYLYAKSARAIGHEDEARRILQRAIRIRPALAETYGFGSGEESRVLETARQHVEEQEKAGTVQEQAAREVEQEDRVLRIEQIRALEGSYRFAEASADYEAYARRATSDSAREDSKRAALRARALVGLFARLVAQAGAGELASIPIHAGSADARLVGGDEREAELRIGSGSAKSPWGFLGLEDLLALAEEVRPSPDEWLALGTFALDQGYEARAWSALARARRETTFAAAVDELVARHRGIPVPPGGFAYHRGEFVSAEEKEKLDRGLVLFRGEWVEPEARVRILKGYQKVGGQWTKLTEAQLVARGWEKVGEEWLSPQEIAARREPWALAEERTTEHYVLHSDRGSSFLDELGEVLEAAYVEFEALFGRKPGQKKRMVVLAFKDFEGYRAYCAKLGKKDVLAALGFAPSEDWTCCGYDKFGDTQIFLQTLVHEAAHLYFWVTFDKNVPSWLAEGMATYFEGFRKKGQRYEFHLPSENRLATLRSAFAAGELDLDSLLDGDAGNLINTSANQALDFYAQAWGLFYFLARSVNPAVREIREEVMKRAETGRLIDLPGIIGDRRRPDFEKALLEFLRGT